MAREPSAEIEFDRLLATRFSVLEKCCCRRRGGAFNAPAAVGEEADEADVRSAALVVALVEVVASFGGRRDEAALALEEDVVEVGVASAKATLSTSCQQEAWLALFGQPSGRGPVADAVDPGDRGAFSSEEVLDFGGCLRVSCCLQH